LSLTRQLAALVDKEQQPYQLEKNEKPGFLLRFLAAGACACDAQSSFRHGVDIPTRADSYEIDRRMTAILHYDSRRMKISQRDQFKVNND
jgi:hypothetical protein